MNTALITGANRGIGLALAQHYFAQGWQVIAACRDPDAAAGLAPEIATGRLEVERLDVADRESIDALAKRIGARPIDLLINNAGIFWRTGPLDRLAPEHWAQTFATNVTGAVELTLGLLPALRAGERKLIVSISSAMGSITGTSGASYAYRASKAALNMAMRSLAMDLAGEGFTFLLQSPGLVDTELARDVPRDKISPAQSVAGMVEVIGGMTKADNGGFRRHTGEVLPW